MARTIFEKIEPGFIFEHEGVKLKATNEVMKDSCYGCYFLKANCFEHYFPCDIDSEFPKQEHTVIFEKVEK